MKQSTRHRPLVSQRQEPRRIEVDLIAGKAGTTGHYLSAAAPPHSIQHHVKHAPVAFVSSNPQSSFTLT